jgi:hypothetical protein
MTSASPVFATLFCDDGLGQGRGCGARTTDVTVLAEDFHDLDSDPAGRRTRRLLAYHPVVRDRIAAVTAGSAAVEDLADSFPALVFAVATHYGTEAGRREALALVGEGAPLRHAAAALGLAWWTRRLPPQAFIEPLRALPDTPAFNERIAGFLPLAPEQARSWLWTVGYGAEACHAGFALWAASWASRQRRTFDAALGRDQFRYLAAWAWHAERPDAPAHALLRRTWTPQTGLRRALDEVAVWRRRLRLAMSLGSKADDPWVENGAALGFDFVALRTPADFISESEAMDNCLDQFAERLEAGRSHVYSIRRDGRPVADLEIGTDDLEAGMPTIQQLRGPRNRRAAPEVWRATYAWLGAQTLRPFMALAQERASTGVRRAARAYWRPYLAAVPKSVADEMAETLAGDLGFRVEPLAKGRPVRKPSAAAPRQRPVGGRDPMPLEDLYLLMRTRARA